MVASSRLESRLAELLLAQLDPCDLGDGIEVVHDVESLEVELECDLGDDEPAAVEALGHGEADQTLELSREAIEALEAIAEEAGTREFLRFSAPYERIELQIEPTAFLRATIEDSRGVSRP